MVSDETSWGSALPLRDGKFSTFEGGMRVPCIVRWPGRVPAGRVSSEVGASFDLLPTFAHFAGIELDRERVIDGKNIAGLLTGTDKSPHEEFFYYRGQNIQAVRRGPWKLNLGRVQQRRNRPDLVTPTSLHYLPSDISEAKNVLEENPSVAAALTKAAEEFDLSLMRERRPAGNLDAE
jgi:arylsulfatase A